MQAMVNRQRICIFDFDAVNFQSSCVPFPTDVINAIDSFLPQMAVYRNEKLQETMRVRIIHLLSLDVSFTFNYFVI